MTDLEKDAWLRATRDMEPVQGTVELDVPIDVLWESFRHANFWPRWNKCFFWASNKDLVKGQKLIWTFQPIKPWLPYKMWAIANIVELEPQKMVTWEVTALPGFYARHTYHMEDLGNGRSRFGSWEQGTGWGFRMMKWFWMRHFPFVKDESLIGAKRLEDLYKKTGKLDPEDLPKKSYVGFWVVMVLLLALIVAAVCGLVFYEKYEKVSSTELAPGVRAFFGGGGNSLLVESEGHSLLVDTKFSPGSKRLHRWIERHEDKPIERLVNTHYHYDHTDGNSLYAGAEMMAGKDVPDLMRKYDNDWWSEHPDGIPTSLVSSERVLQVGDIEVRLEPVSVPAHTATDLWVYLPKQNIIATGDLVFNTYYPFLDQPEGGTSIPGMEETVRALAQQHPDATFVPGHGPVAHASDLQHYADYLRTMQAEAVAAHAQGLSEDDAAKRTVLGKWGLSVLPSYHHHKLIWSTASNDARWAYVLAGEGPRAEGKKL